METYDLTKKSGLNRAKGLIRPGVVWLGISPPVFLVKLLYNVWSDHRSAALEEQMETARKLIVFGRDTRLKEMRIRLNNKSAATIGATLEEGVKLDFGAEHDGSIEVVATYG